MKCRTAYYISLVTTFHGGELDKWHFTLESLNCRIRGLPGQRYDLNGSAASSDWGSDPLMW